MVPLILKSSTTWKLAMQRLGICGGISLMCLYVMHRTLKPSEKCKRAREALYTLVFLDTRVCLVMLNTVLCLRKYGFFYRVSDIVEPRNVVNCKSGRRKISAMGARSLCQTVPVDACLQTFPLLFINNQDNSPAMINVGRILIFNADCSSQLGFWYLTGYLLMLPCV
jgi:hypothetical protein